MLHPFNEAAQMKIGTVHPTIAQSSQFRIHLKSTNDIQAHDAFQIARSSINLCKHGENEKAATPSRTTPVASW
uniref:AlNc14C82G5329 protein n=1 Tax=Albugo laibachii Nc14 TaxID=890382 RepID=F0WFD9_9STRA|nr:AlNc14C82G5329 [Albugo laibachii Nc14]|eukprot:CCA19921.1 AlNc14C82G5329 [Albugo laibachii Nc14]